MKSRFLLSFLLLSALASAQTYTESILYNFTSTNGTGPNGLVRDSAGNLYGTMSAGGTGTCSILAAPGCGLVYKLSSGNVFSILHTFTGGTDGSYPFAALAIDKSGNLYGTTLYGGLGYGTVFKITAAGKYSILHKFGKVSGDGYYPAGPVTLDSTGNMYGTTEAGGIVSSNCYTGTTGCGTIYKVTPKGVETLVYKFTGEADNSWPSFNVLRDGKGNFYGTNQYGATAPSLYEVTASGIASSLYDFFNDGNDVGYIARSATGTFYGAFDDYAGSNQSGAWEFLNGVEVNYNNNPQGWELSTSPVIISGGNMYGTAAQGGAYWTVNCGMGGSCGSGDVYELDPVTGVVTLLHSFPDIGSTTTDGGTPTSGVIVDTHGNFYGTTYGGGTYGLGTIFKLTLVN